MTLIMYWTFIDFWRPKNTPLRAGGWYGVGLLGKQIKKLARSPSLIFTLVPFYTVHNNIKRASQARTHSKSDLSASIYIDQFGAVSFRTRYWSDSYPHFQILMTSYKLPLKWTYFAHDQLKCFLFCLLKTHKNSIWCKTLAVIMGKKVQR